VERIRVLLERARLPVQAPATMTEQQFLDLMAVDKKVLDGGLRLVLLKAIGEAVISGDFQPRHLRETLAAAL
jgi:3-dehydroquinate synthase